MIHSLIAQGVPPHIVYAYSKTGMLVTTQMYAQLSEGDRKRWDDALRDLGDGMGGRQEPASLIQRPRFAAARASRAFEYR